MIQNLRIRNFKSHQNTSIDLGNLTVLCGQNGTGKSAIIQSLLLLRQSHKKNRLEQGLDLNKPLCNIGSAEDALCFWGDSDTIDFQISAFNNDFQWSFDASKNSTFLRKVNSIVDANIFKNLNLFKTNTFQYISAARNTSYETDDFSVQEEKQLSINEGKGELVAQFLVEYGDKLRVCPSLLHDNDTFTDLLNQTIAWEGEISNGVQIIPVKEGPNYLVKYNFHTSSGPIKNNLSDKNVGFGLSYTLPVIVALLAANEGDLIIIENPEAHVHPSGQTKLAELICKAAQTGVQVIIETHSDHIINGIMVQSKRFETEKIGLDKNNLAIYYIEKNESGTSANTSRIEVQKNGRIKNAPKGFFDQFSTDLKYLMSSNSKSNG